jgi:hypothetical protein
VHAQNFSVYGREEDARGDETPRLGRRPRADPSVAILGTIKAAAPSGAKLLLLEMVAPEHDREFLGHYADMEMLAGALERGLKQWTDLLRRPGSSSCSTRELDAIDGR